MSSAYWRALAKSYGDLFYTPKSLPNFLLLAKFSSDSKAINFLHKGFDRVDEYHLLHTKYIVWSYEEKDRLCHVRIH